MALLAAPAPAWGQERSGFHPRWEIPGFDFRPDGAWRGRAKAVAEWRRRLMARGDLEALNAPVTGARLQFAGPQTGPAVGGTLKVPALLFSYKGVDSLQMMRNPALYQDLLFGPVPPGGDPYTLRTLYAEMSNNLLDMQGQVIGWVRLDSVEAFYAGQPGSCFGNPYGTTNCNGLFSSAAITSMRAGYVQALTRVDPGVDFGQFDNDGPDGLPNSNDDDGFVDMIAFIHPTRDGACGGAFNNHIWAHRFTVAYTTNDPSNAPGGGNVRIFDYFAQSGLGGTSGCDSTQIMPIGTASHEFGHALGLPDLYDVSNASEGIGEWGLMGSGNWTTQRSPSRMEAWSLNQLGWISLRQLTATGTYHVGAVPTADTAFLVRPTINNPRGEYFLVENRQSVLSDSAMIRVHCGISGNPPGCGGGLLVWQVDSIKMLGGGVNSGAIHGLRLLQADGLNHLDNASPPANRGDAGDPYPGISNKTVVSFATNPSLRLNFDGKFPGFAIDSIRQVVPNGEMAFRLRFGGLTLVQASDTAASVIVEGDTTRRFADLLANGAQLTIEVPDSQVAANGRSRWTYVSWSDGGARSHQITGSVGDSTIVANVTSEYLLQVAGGPGGTLTPSHPVAPGGSFFFRDTAVTLTPLPNAGFEFGSWNGDTISLDSVLVLGMRRPYSVTACFQPAMSITSAMARPAGVMGVSYADTLVLSAGACRPPQWLVVTGILPVGLTLNIQGRITGVPAQTGVFPFRARATAGRTVIEKDFTLTVTAPTLATATVVGHLLGGSGLTFDELRYLDLLGNNNSQFDVGDFLAWVNATGAPLTAQAAALLGRTP